MNIIIKYIKWYVDYGTQLFIPLKLNGKEILKN